jgi:hypothetical protein
MKEEEEEEEEAGAGAGAGAGEEEDERTVLFLSFFLTRHGFCLVSKKKTAMNLPPRATTPRQSSLTVTSAASPQQFKPVSETPNGPLCHSYRSIQGKAAGNRSRADSRTSARIFAACCTQASPLSTGAPATCVRRRVRLCLSSHARGVNDTSCQGLWHFKLQHLQHGQTSGTRSEIYDTLFIKATLMLSIAVSDATC